MEKILSLLFILSVLSYSQNYKIEKVTGTVKALSNNSENWIDVKVGNEFPSNTIIDVGKNSSVTISGNEGSVILTENSAVTLSSIKKMSIEDLLLALAMENILNAPRNNQKNKSQNTAVYGKNEFEKNPLVTNDVFGIKRLNGAKQLAENGLKESAVVTAKEVFRKYPSTRAMSDYRIYFADILYDKKLYEEALDEYSEILKLNLESSLKEKVNQRIDEINKKISR